jgi:hypothetical protein
MKVHASIAAMGKARKIKHEAIRVRLDGRHL